MGRTKRIALAVLVSGVAMWLLAGLWHTVLMTAFYVRETGAEHEGVGVIFVAYIILAALMVGLHVGRASPRRPVLEGAKLGVIVGVLWVFPHELAMAGAHGESIVYVFRNAAWHLVEQGLGGVIIGAIVGAGGPRDSPVSRVAPGQPPK